MPIYEFKCASCGAKFEKLISISNNEMPGCPGCSGNEVKKLFSSFGFTSSGKASSGGACSSCSSTSCATCGQ